jgi:hypothetical protein
MESSAIDAACRFQIGSEESVSLAQRLDYRFQIVADLHTGCSGNSIKRVEGSTTGEPCGLLSRDSSLLALGLALLYRFLRSLWLSNRDSCECAEGRAQNFSLSREPMVLGISFRASVVKPKAIGTFADSLFQILHHQVSLARPEPAWQTMVNEILIS